MPVTRYIYANGVKIAQVKNGVRTDYLTDALGSVTATKNQSQQIVNTYRYKPYGGLLAKTGTGEDPRYLWTGNTGSRTTNTRFANQYNVARHYANGPAAWTTVDPLWPGALSLSYAAGKPTGYLDPVGNIAVSLNAFIHRDQSKRSNSVVDCNGKLSHNWVKAPFNPSGLIFYRGDNRDFSFDVPGKTSRVSSRLEVDDCSVGDLPATLIPSVFSDRTQGMVYENKGLIGPICLVYKNPRPQVSLFNTSVTNVRKDGKVGHSIVKYSFMARDPLVWLSPHLRADATIHLITDFCKGNVFAHILVRHTRYPWFESYAQSANRYKWMFKHHAWVDDLVEGLQAIRISGGSANFRIPKCKQCCS